MKKMCCSLFLALSTAVSADRVVLISGEVLEGEIISEDAREMVFETARTRSRSHRIVHHLSHDIVRTATRANPRPTIMPELAPGSAANEEPEPTGPAYDLRALNDALQQRDLLNNQQYPQAVEHYKLLAERAYLGAQSPESLADKVELLTIQQNAYDLWVIALEGQIEAMEEREERAEDAVKNALEQAEDQLDALRDQLDDDNRNRGRVTRLGSNRTPEQNASPAEKALIARVRQAQQRMSQFDAWKRDNGDKMKNLEAEAELTKEKSNQVKRNIADAKRELKDEQRTTR